MIVQSLRNLVKLQTNKKCRSDYKAEYVFDLIVAGFQMNISWKGEGKDRCNMWSCMNVILKLCFGVAGADRFQLLWGFTQPVNSTIWLYIRYVSDFWVGKGREWWHLFALFPKPRNILRFDISLKHFYFVTLVNINKSTNWSLFHTYFFLPMFFLSLPICISNSNQKYLFIWQVIVILESVEPK